MSWLKAYANEHARFKREQQINLLPRYAELMTHKVAAMFGLRVKVEMTNRSWGRCNGWRITLPYKGASLGMVLHEVAHAYDRQKYGHHSHTGTFKNALGIVYSQTQVRLRELLLGVKAQVEKETADAMLNAQKVASRELSAAERRERGREIRKSRGYRIAHTEQRIKRLESKAKRLQTLLRSARRSLSHLRRWERKEVSNGTNQMSEVRA